MALASAGATFWSGMVPLVWIKPIKPFQCPTVFAGTAFTKSLICGVDTPFNALNPRFIKHKRTLVFDKWGRLW